MKYIDSERLRAEIKFAKSVYDDHKRVVHGVADAYRQDGRAAMCDDILKKIDSLQQDETQLDKILCSQVWWEEQGWIMIPPDATIEGIDSLLRQVKKKLQQEQPELPGYDKALLDVKSKVDELYEEASIGLSEYDSGLYNGIAETCMKLRGFIKARLDSDEQPEVDLDLDADIEMEWDSFNKHLAEYGGESEEVVWLNRYNFNEIARQFYELGLNARKEN